MAGTPSKAVAGTDPVRESSGRTLPDRAVAAFCAWLAGAAVLCVIGMMILMTIEVVSRYLFNAPTTWSDEVASYLLAAIVFLGLAQNLRLGSHIRIDVVTNAVSSRTRGWLELYAHAVGLVFAIVLLIGTWIRLHNFWVRNTTSDSPLMTPLWLPMTPVLIGAAALALVMLTGLAACARALRTGRKGTETGKETGTGDHDDTAPPIAQA